MLVVRQDRVTVGRAGRQPGQRRAGRVGRQVVRSDKGAVRQLDLDLEALLIVRSVLPAQSDCGVACLVRAGEPRGGEGDLAVADGDPLRIRSLVVRPEVVAVVGARLESGDGCRRRVRGDGLQFQDPIHP